ncbi:MAG: DUF3616 domain-containing protein [Myxococcota bacterium]
MLAVPTIVALLACGGAQPAPADADAPFARTLPPPPAPPAAATGPELSLIPGPDLVGLCDASAAVAIGDRLVVADDEHNVLRVFDWSRAAEGAAPPVASIDLTALSPLFAGKEADLEGVAAMPDGTVWFTASHDSGKDTERQPQRQRLFALRFADDAASATLAQGPATGLIDAGQEQSQLYGIVVNTVGHTSKDPEGLSIEGLAAGPDGSLLIGFRAPVHGGKALIERLDDPVAFAGGAAPTFTGPRWIDLGGRGIRSLEREGDGTYLLIGGSPGEDDASFLLYRWHGFDDGAPPERLAVAFGDLHPEALVRAGGAWWVLSDDGRRDIDGKDCKKLPAEARRARTARLVGL